AAGNPVRGDAVLVGRQLHGRVYLPDRDAGECYAVMGLELALCKGSLIDSGQRGDRKRNRSCCAPHLEAVPDDASLAAISASAPANGWKLNRTMCFPRGTATARKMPFAFMISASLPSTVAHHQGAQTSLRSRIPPAGASTSTVTSVFP